MRNEIIDACDRARRQRQRQSCGRNRYRARVPAPARILSSGGDTFDADAREDRKSGLNPDGGGLLTLRFVRTQQTDHRRHQRSGSRVGLTMTLAMDIRLAADTAKFGLVSRVAVSSRMLVPAISCRGWSASPRHWSGAIPAGCFPRRRLSPGGWVKSLHPKEELLDAAYAIAADIRDNCAPVSVALIRHMMWKMLGADHPMEAHKIESRGIYHRGRSADAGEGVESFLEKRPAEFKQNVSNDMPEFFPWWDKRTFS